MQDSSLAHHRLDDGLVVLHRLAIPNGSDGEAFGMQRLVPSPAASFGLGRKIDTTGACSKFDTISIREQPPTIAL